jgi:hypothetical protein
MERVPSEFSGAAQGAWRAMQRAPLLVLLAFLMAASMWLYVQLVLIPYQVTQGPMRENPRGNLSDLYPRWLGARELLLHHRDPYSVDITRESQLGYYGRPLDPSRPSDPKDQQAFAYPVYVVLLLAPTVTLPFSTVHRFFFWFFIVLTAVSVPLWMQTLRWRVSKAALCSWVLLTLSCFPVIQALKLQQLTILVAGLVAGSMYVLVREHFGISGVLLALASIKPQLVFLLVLWVCIWVIGDWRKRRFMMWSYVICMLLLVVSGEVLLPGWIPKFYGAVKNYNSYTGGGNLLTDLLPPTLGEIMSALLVGVVLVFGWRNRFASSKAPAFQWLLSLTLATTLLVIRYSPYNLLLLLPSLMMLLRMWRSLWQKSRVSRFLCSITALSVFWPFLGAVGLVIALAFVPEAVERKVWGAPLYLTYTIPLTIYALLLVSKEVLSDGALPNIAD